jgi:hypothetical protein
MNKELEKVLNECLERMLLKGETAEQCLQSFPAYAEELRPLLETTAAAAGQVTALKPSAEFRERARNQMQWALRDAVEKKSRPAFGWSWQPGWATAIVSIALILLLSGGGTVAAAAGSMPDDTLYPVKLATEQARMALTFSELGKAELNAKLADQRVNEIVYLAENNKTDIIEPTADRLNRNLAAIATLSSPGEGTMQIVAAPAPTGESGTAPMAPAVVESAGEPALTAPAVSGTTGEAPVAAPSPSSPEEPVNAASATEAPKRLQASKAEKAEAVPGEVKTYGATENADTAGGETVTAAQYSPGSTGGAGVDRREQLRITVINQANTNSVRLRAVLEEVPEPARPALTRAIDSLEAGYQNAIDSLAGQ